MSAHNAESLTDFSLEERDKYIKIFQKADSGNVGMLTNERAKEIFKKSGLSSKILSHIWYLANLNSNGCLLQEDFCIVMHLIHLARQGLSLDKLTTSNNLIAILKIQKLRIEKSDIFKTVQDLRKKLIDNLKSFKQNEVKKSLLSDKIYQSHGFINDYKISLEVMQQQIHKNQALISQLQSLLENYQLKLNFSKQQHIKIKNCLDSQDPNIDNLTLVTSSKKKEISLLINQLESLRISLLKKSKRHELLKNVSSSNGKSEENVRNELCLSSNFSERSSDILFSKDLSNEHNLLNHSSNLFDLNARKMGIKELIVSEEAYINDLSIIFEVFYDMIKKENIFNKSEMGEVFMNLEDIVNCNKDFLRALQIRICEKIQDSDEFTVGDVIFEHLQRMDPYIVFCSFQHRRSILLQDKIESDFKFKEFHKKLCQHERVSGLSLNSFLLKPMQRITKYPLLIDKILLSTPSEFRDYKYLEEAKSKASNLCNNINEASREQQNSDSLSIIQSRVRCDGGFEKLNFKSETNFLGPRKYLYSGLLYKIKNNKELMGLLFTDFFMLTLPSKYIGHASSIISQEIKPSIFFRAYKKPILLNEMSISPILDDVTQTSLKVIHKNKILYLKAPSQVERDSWIKKIESASREYFEYEKKIKIRVDALKNSRPIGRLLVCVKEGINLKVTEDFMFCKINMGAHEQKSKAMPGCLNPMWDTSAQFPIFDVRQDVLHIEIFSKKDFSKNVSLGWAEVATSDILETIKETKEPIIKHLLLNEKGSGEIIVKLDMQLYTNQK